MKKTEQIAFIDFEMNSNGDMKKSELEIIQAAVVVCDLKGKVLRRYKTFVRPGEHKKIYSYTTFLCGITQKDMRKAISFNEMLKRINITTSKCSKIYCWGNVDRYCIKNASNFLPFVDKRNKKWLLMRLQDVSKEISKKIVKGKVLSLIDAAKAYNILNKDAEAKHHADYDADLLRKVYFHK